MQNSEARKRREEQQATTGRDELDELRKLSGNALSVCSLLAASPVLSIGFNPLMQEEFNRLSDSVAAVCSTDRHTCEATALKEQLAQSQRLTEWAWTIIANVDGGTFEQSDEWLVAMAKFRDEYDKTIRSDASIETETR